MENIANFDEHKMAELILFFSRESEDDRHFGATKLNKLLFTADFWAYGYLGSPITGAAYIHQEHGPAPDPMQFLTVRETLVTLVRLEIVEEQTYSRVRKRPRAKDDPDLTLFTKEELEICRDALEYLRPLTAYGSKEWSHNLLGWRYTEMDETIPYSTAFSLQGNLVTQDDILWARRTAKELGLVDHGP